jgi:hypothetical protein
MTVTFRLGIHRCFDVALDDSAPEVAELLPLKRTGSVHGLKGLYEKPITLFRIALLEFKLAEFERS